jgi:GrpB-like predicted nucleotidyltransferase (UPF0157 family)
MIDFLVVHEEGRPLTYTVEDLNRYHGFGFPGGVAHAFKVMQRALPLLSPDAPPERREITVRTPFKGPGARDAFEMVTRATSEGRYTVDDTLLAPERGDILKGYVFVLGYRDRQVKLIIRKGIVREEFILLGRKLDRTPEEDQRLATLKLDMAERLLRLPAEDVYDPV